MSVQLVEITRDNLDELMKLDAGDGGRQVASNMKSMAQAAVYAEAWPRGIAVEGRLVGFLMLYDPSLTPTPEEPEFALWRLMIDQREQGRGHGAAAVRALIEHVRGRPGAEALYLSYVQDSAKAAAAERFYRSLGFAPTGEIDDGEVVMRLSLSAQSAAAP
ncbi:GNAT family N-acetyltransferase [Roseateles sp. DAIF2]|uniref:GNAT family N-acetyltransferase n=1 Tax=Roseateles sp. DAIF2 TaxID=2714952 RepID=UPI0018A2FC81|nr:GNAT family N-acetyltransferase [Roseateles sp. DAIF2]QPF71982.1 GNAT family N-acetyltransferase [Roseateles sp. DAIF2]